MVGRLPVPAFRMVRRLQITMKNLLRLFSLLFAMQFASAQTQWTQRPSNTAGGLSGVAFGTNSFVAGGAQVSLTSTNGQTWSLFPFTNNVLQKVIFANGTWVATNFSNQIYTSPNGQTWTLRYTAPYDIRGFAYGNGVVVAVGTAGQIHRSTDNGVAWNIATSPTSRNIGAVAYGSNTFVAIADGQAALTSTDGLIWTLRTNNLPADAGFRTMAYCNGVFVAGANSLTARSIDNGQTWTSQSLPQPFSLWALAYTSGTLVGVGQWGAIHTSNDAGQTWTLQTSGVNFDLGGIAYGGGTWVAVGNNGGILTSAAENIQPPLVPAVNISQAVKLDWQSQDGALYQVQSSADMSTWQDTGLPLMGDGLPKTFFDGTASAVRKFYRIQIK